MNRIFVAAVLAILAITPAFGKDLRADKNKANRAQDLHRYPFARKVRGGV
jgi:hypothetical protein